MTTESQTVRHAREIFSAALADCSVERAYERKLRVVEQAGRTVLQLAGETVDLTDVRHLCMVSAGKAAKGMLMGFLARVSLPKDCAIRGVLVAPDRPHDLPGAIEYFAGGHPLPNQASFDGAGAALRLVREACTLDGAFCLFLISGGGSAMMELPLAPDVSVDEAASFYRILVHSGATIAEINCVRKHFSAIKGGRLGAAAGPVPALTVLVSDVPAQHLDALSSGPTIADPTTIADCREVLARYCPEDMLPLSVRGWFASAGLPETPKTEEQTTLRCVLLDSDELAEAAGRYASGLGYHVVLDHACDDWSFDEAANYLLERVRALRIEHERVCLLSAGEVTVSVPSLSPEGSHLGGRNQHFVLHVATLLMPADEGLTVLSAGSDGVDGNSFAAGGVIEADTLRVGDRTERARQALQQFDSSRFLAMCNATVTTGPTGTNLRDLRVFLAG